MAIHGITKSSISSTAYAKSYLSTTWSRRSELNSYERRGFAQFVYVVLCGHLECLLSKKIETRLSCARQFLDFDKLSPVILKNNGIKEQCSTAPLAESVKSILLDLESSINNAPISRLIHIYDRVFQVRLIDLIGKELYSDIDSLAGLRNLFAHGRDISVDLDGGFPGKADLSRNPLLKPAKRLNEIGVIDTLDVNMNNMEKFESAFHSDDAVLHFYRAVKKIEDIVVSDLEFLFEEMTWHVPTLPELNA